MEDITVFTLISVCWAYCIFGWIGLYKKMGKQLPKNEGEFIEYLKNQQ